MPKAKEIVRENRRMPMWISIRAVPKSASLAAEQRRITNTKRTIRDYRSHLSEQNQERCTLDGQITQWDRPEANPDIRLVKRSRKVHPSR